MPKKNQASCEFFVGGKYCMRGLFNAKPSVDDCLSCDKYNGVSRGLGDVVTKLLKKTRLDKLAKKKNKRKPCGCAKRRKALNKAFPRKDQWQQI